MEPCVLYTCLESAFTADGSVSSGIVAHALTRITRFNNFSMFLSKKDDFSFIVKKRIFDAVLMSAILHGFESSVGAYFKPITNL